MCSHRYILNRFRTPLYLNCGFCPSCLQEKAIQRTNRIRNNGSNGGMILFVTLTYSNGFVPYFDYDLALQNDVQKFKCSNPTAIRSDLVGMPYLRIPIYRNRSVRYVKDHNFKISHRWHKHIVNKKQLLDIALVPVHFLFENSCFKTPLPAPRRIRHHGKEIDKPRISVIHYKDVQDFFKRLRINLSRNKDTYDYNFKYFSCAEYGGNFTRSHFHALLYVSKGTFTEWQDAIVKAWPFSSDYVTRQGVEIAYDAASYVSSYLNNVTSLPILFKCDAFKQRCSFSKGFGFAKNEFSFAKVCEAIRKRDLRYVVRSTREGVPVDVPLLLPKYVINRYFPKYKGFGLLTSNEIIDVCSGFKSVGAYAEALRLTSEDVRKIDVMLRNKRAYALSHGVPPVEFGILYSQVWPLRSSQFLRSWYESDDFLSPKTALLAYDNFQNYVGACGHVFSPSLEPLVRSLSQKIILSLPRCINSRPSIIARTARNEAIFFQYDKTKKTRHDVYSKSSNSLYF